MTTVTTNTVRISISTVEEWNNLTRTADETKRVLVLQVGAHWCRHCQPVEEAFQSLGEKYTFDFVYTDASDSELTDHFLCKRLPTIVIYIPGNNEAKVIESVRCDNVDIIAKEYFHPKLVLDEDF